MAPLAPTPRSLWKRRLSGGGITVGLLLLGAASGAPASPQSPEASARPAIVYGGNKASPPFEYLDQSGAARGFNVELVRALGRVSGREVEVRLGVWKDIVATVATGEVDLVTIGYSEARTAEFDFVAETWTLRQAVFFPPGRAAPPMRAEEMRGETVAVQLDSIVHELLRALPEAQRPTLRAAPSHLDAARLLARGEATAVAGNSLVLRTALDDLGLPNAIEVPVQAASYQLATGKGRGPEMAWILPALQRLKDSGEYSQLVERHLATRRPPSPWPVFAGALLAAILVGGLGYLGARLWNASLRRQVAARTSQLVASSEEKDRLTASLAEREASLRTSEERYALAAQATRDVIWDRDFEINRVLWSPGLLTTFGHPVPSANVSSAWWEEKVHPEDRDRAVAAFEVRAMPMESRVGAEYRFRRADGSYAHVADRAIVLRDEHGRPLRMIGAITDITARREAEAERERLIADLEAKNTELERFTYTVSHDLKSPLVTIGAYAGLLEKHVRDGDMERFTGDVARIQRAGERMRRLLDELLELSRIGRVVSPPEDVSLRDLAHEAAALVKGRLSERSVDIRIAEELPMVRGDRVRLLEVMLNLIDNAAKFVSAGQDPRIEVGVSAGQPAPSFLVRDNGIGIDPQHQERVFGLFDKLDSGSEGTGVGLALVRRIVEAHGGRVWIESAGRGQGTTFHVSLAS